MRFFGAREVTLVDLGIEVSKLSLKPDDVVVLQCRDRLTEKEAKALRKAWDECMPGRRAIVLEKGMTIASKEQLDRLRAELCKDEVA